MTISLLCLISVAYSQQGKLQAVTGTISFVTPQNIYVKFQSTEGINQGDTLFYDNNGTAQPGVIAKYISSQSCAGPRLGTLQLKVGDRMFALVKADKITAPQPEASGSQKDTSSTAGNTPNVGMSNESSFRTNFPTSRFYGNLSGNSYSNFSNFTSTPDIQRWSYTLTMNAENIEGSSFYFSNYSNLSYLNTDLPSMKANIFNNLKIYDLSFGYKTNDYDTWFGRHINYFVSNIGPVDGLQMEKRLGNYWIGGIAGSRPDYYNMTFNIRYAEVGAYLSRVDTMSNGTMQNTFGVFEQMNDLMTDRRFIYLQHTSNPIPSLSFFASTEMDLFKLENSKSVNDFSLTSLYVSAQFAPSSRISFSLSYDARRNVIYYQTFGSQLDSILQSELRHGVHLWMSWRPVNLIVANVNLGYSYQPGDIIPSRNVNASLTETEIPLVLVSATVSYNKIISSYLNGTIYGVQFMKYVPFNFTSLSLGYQRISYNFGGTANSLLVQNIATAEASMRVIGQLFFNAYYQGTFSHQTTYGTLLGGFSLRF